jgi:hypothetical protein
MILRAMGLVFYTIITTKELLLDIQILTSRRKVPFHEAIIRKAMTVSGA